MRHIFLIYIIIISLDSFAQNDSTQHRHSGAMQFGGQTMVSFHYEYSLIMRKHFFLKSNIGLGLNENADDTDPNDRAIYGIHSGLISLIGTTPIYLELGINPTTYFYKTTTFVNINSWVGFRLTPKKIEGLFVSAGYTPRLYTTYSDPNNHYFNATIGVKFGLTF